MYGVADPRCRGPGSPLVEIFSVRINKINGGEEEDPAKVYGKIKVSDSDDDYYIYNREKEDYESVSMGNTVLLTGPTRSIFAYDYFKIKVYLVDKISVDKFSRAIIYWTPYDRDNEYNKLLSSDLSDEYGSVTVNYAILCNAVEAIVEVTLINNNKDGDGDGDGGGGGVYGQITANNGIGETVLFRKRPNENMNISAGQPIPLSRSVVAVRLHSNLIVSADLHDYDTDVSPDDAILNNTTAKFRAKLSGTFEKNISGKYGEARVKVTWVNVA